MTLAFPDVVRIEPASACNLRCVHCPTGTIKSVNRGIMSQKTFSVIMANLEQKLPRVVVMYHGGEPLLCIDVWNWIKVLKMKGVKYIKTVTNGTLLYAESIKGILTSGLDAIEFSIDGKSPEENDTIRRGSNCQEIIGNIKELVEFKRLSDSRLPEICISNVQLKNHVNSDVPETPKFLIEEFGESVMYKNTYAIKWPAVASSFSKRPQILEKGYCPHLFETITIRWNGDVVPCCYDIMSEYVIGNIHENSLEEIWNNERYNNIRKGIETGHPVEICGGCYEY
ncbi:hypothetical protein LCGC14_1595890 [marine sediment metagenome]|uniref:Radical SAM core domain-containing protein n=1 Tax=marine sediment metagenome TaxID=412755 RepID=A0A0F9IYY6_9ZZZZ